MTEARTKQFPIGSSITVEQLTQNPYDILAELRASEPVSWLPAINGWFVTDRTLGLQAMRDAAVFTVDDPRFTTAAVLGPSMLSLDGVEHTRHREPFAAAFRPQPIRDHFDGFLRDEAERLVALIRADGHAELRTSLAGPLAVAAITEFLGLVDVDTDEVLRWHTSIADAIVAQTAGQAILPCDATAIAELRRRVEHTMADGADTSLVRSVRGQGVLGDDELTSAIAVLMFGAIETAEGMTANALWHLLSHPEELTNVRSNRDLVPIVVDESLRLEPAATFIDRYATRETTLGAVPIDQGELVTISLLAANRDPALFEDPDSFSVKRANSHQHVSFVQGPHGCIGLHLARLETTIAVHAVLDHLGGIELDEARSTPPTGLIFRKPDRLWATWQANKGPDSPREDLPTRL